MDSLMKNYWDTIYLSKAENEVSWYQPHADTSMELIDAINLPLDAAVIDIGGGDSHFAEALLNRGFSNIYVLDISEVAIQRAKDRLGERASLVHWIVSDITEFRPNIQFDCWHDRAAFHFLTIKDKISKYVSLVNESVKKNGYLMIGTFSESGPLKCSGLEIKQYSDASMNERFIGSFEPIQCIYKDHHTPFGTVQNFIFCSFKKK